MYLKSIEVQGFKSFAQKITFEFHNGITAIVGPNGSGKSNVGDAVRWVLGEQSAKQLRGGNMQDVIFSGTELRKPLSYAAVAITLDNSDHALPVDFQEVTVARRLYRSGESEYMINGASCRLRDVNELFYDTGIGKEGYSIIGQGQIDRILSGKPEERRELFDEAAGIVKFKRRKSATIKKLESEENNLVRVTDILSELTRQLGPLERQSENARIYLARRDEQKSLDVNLFLSEQSRIGASLKELGDKLELASSELGGAQSDYEKTRQEYDRLEQEAADLSSRLDEVRELAQQEALKKQDLEGRIRLLDEQIASAASSEEHYKNRMAAIRSDLDSREKEKERLQTESSISKKNLSEASGELSVKESLLADLGQQLEQAGQAQGQAREELKELLEKRAGTRGLAERSDTLLEQIEIKKAQISQQLLQLKTRMGLHEQAVEKAKEEEKEISEKLEAMTKEGNALHEKEEALGSEIRKQTQQMEIGQATFHRESSRLESLKNMAERYDGYGNAIRRVMEQKKRTPGLLGVVADLIHTEKTYEIAIETALGGSIQNIVTDNEETAKQMIAYLKKGRFGRATFLPLSAISSRGDFNQKGALKEKGVIGLASDLVETEPAYEGLAKYLLGRVLVAKNIDDAVAIARKYSHSLRIVTLEGELLSPGGSMSGGSFKSNSNLLGRSREIEELGGSIAALQKDMEALSKGIEQNRKERTGLRDKITALSEQIRSGYVEQNTARMKIRSLEEEARRFSEDREQIRLDSEDLEREKEKILSDTESIRSQLDESKRDEAELESFIADQGARIAELSERRERISSDLEKARLARAGAEQQQAFYQENLDRIESEMKSLGEEASQILESLKSDAKETQKKYQDIENLNKACASFEESAKVHKEEADRLAKERDEKKVQNRTFFERRDSLSSQIASLDKECYRLKSQIEKLEESLESQINYLWEEYQITPSLAKELKSGEEMPAKEMKKRIAQIREEIRSLGPVNVAAIEEYKEIKERHSFLKGQYDDLKEAKESLEKIILELDEGMRRQFAEKFKEIQIEYNKTFKELFGGGRGTLELEEEADILEAGIRIIAQPPGKKLQNMMQLSGGEKALSAISLLFAIQNLKPSPFCLLDEIEAALDDSNVGRFAGYLKKLTKNTQFIVITHRRGTMTSADRLYGITMQEKGVSTLVSVDLVENSLT